MRAPTPSALRIAAVAVALWAGGAASVRAADPVPGPPLAVRRVAAPIVLDGDLTDAGWQGVEPVTTWFETRVGDNVAPQVGNAAYLAYDDKYFYAGFRFDDPDPEAIRAPLGDHDALSGSTDYAGVIVDSRNDGKTAAMFLANARGLRYDALTSDASGEDSSPDFFWDAAGRITESGWNLEIRVPFSSLRYGTEPDQTWGILLYRNYPRDRRYQFFSARLPRDVNCFVCNSSKMSGLSSLPRGSHLVVAPFATGSQTHAPSGDLGSALEARDFESEGGVDVKWNPVAGIAIDATVNPDFSQVESDDAQIVANERFALFFPEKRPFFLEGVDLFSTPLQAAYTRTITDPSGGLRATGRVGATAYTALVTRDHGGGIVILPGPQGSDAALQDFRSDVGIARVRHDLGRSSVSLLATTREIRGGGHSRVGGPDVEWRPRGTDTFRAQALWSESRTPDRTDLAGEWDGRTLAGQAYVASWSHSTRTVDWYVQGQDLSEDFRADNGFIPQVGYREVYVEPGYTFRPTGFMNRVRIFSANWVDVDRDAGGDVISRRASVGAGMDGRWASFVRIELNRDDIRVGDALRKRFRPRLYLEANPGRLVSNVNLDTYVGDEIDFANGREGSGATLNGGFSLRPNDHLELRGTVRRRWLDVDGPGASGRLFTADVQRLRATWMFNARSFLRLIGQHVHTRRDPALYTFAVAGKDAAFSTSALFAYKLNWQTVLYAGYGDERAFAETTGELEASTRQAFAKASYAWQP